MDFLLLAAMSVWWPGVGSAGHASSRERLQIFSVHLILKCVLIFPWIFWYLRAEEIKMEKKHGLFHVSYNLLRGLIIDRQEKKPMAFSNITFLIKNSKL